MYKYSAPRLKNASAMGAKQTKERKGPLLFQSSVRSIDGPTRHENMEIYIFIIQSPCAYIMTRVTTKHNSGLFIQTAPQVHGFFRTCETLRVLRSFFCHEDEWRTRDWYLPTPRCPQFLRKHRLHQSSRGACLSMCLPLPPPLLRPHLALSARPPHSIICTHVHYTTVRRCQSIPRQHQSSMYSTTEWASRKLPHDDPTRHLCKRSWPYETKR